MRDRSPHRELRPLLFLSSVWPLLRPTELIMKSFETGPAVYRPFPRRLESLTICRCHYKGGAFSTIILRPWVLVWPGFEPATSRTLIRCSATGWGNRSAIPLACYTLDLIFSCLHSICLLALTPHSSLRLTREFCNSELYFLKQSGAFPKVPQLQPSSFAIKVLLPWYLYVFCQMPSFLLFKATL